MTTFYLLHNCNVRVSLNTENQDDILCKKAVIVKWSNHEWILQVNASPNGTWTELKFPLVSRVLSYGMKTSIFPPDEIAKLLEDFVRHSVGEKPSDEYLSDIEKQKEKIFLWLKELA